jgi:hypothetical protein
MDFSVERPYILRSAGSNLLITVAMIGLEKVCELGNSRKKKQGRDGWEVDLATELSPLSPSAACTAVASSCTSGYVKRKRSSLLTLILSGRLGWCIISGPWETTKGRKRA